MRTAPIKPSRDPPWAARSELLHESHDGRVIRLDLTWGGVIREQALGPVAPRRRQHELDLLKRLAGVEGILPLAVDAPACPRAVQLVDMGGTVLSRRAMPLSPEEVLRLAEPLARTVAGMHRRRVLHQDINPANILVSEHGVPYLFNFLHATAFAAVQPGFLHPNEIVGAVPYLAPEQTGRTGRLVDLRSDLYALGATLYELATGTPPFGTGDVLRIIHDHLAQIPKAPSAVNPAVPADLSAVIMHLLEKEPDDRYQGAEGLVHDLSAISRGEPLARPGEHDLQAPAPALSRLTGRTAEISELDAVFRRATDGRCPGLLVGGVAGVGKTALVNELRPLAAANNGWFVAGKFDRYRRDLEYDGVRQAFRSLIRLLLAEPENVVADVRARLRHALGANAGLAASIVPELGTLLDVSPAADPAVVQPPVLGDAIKVLRAIASRERPVVLVVDDLQWAGRVPLKFLDLMLSDDEPIEGLLLVCAYRDGGLDPAHPLSTMLDRWRELRPAPAHIRLANLTTDGQAGMVADLLRVAPEPAGELARLIAPATRGNPYDTTQLLDALRQDGILARGPDGWRWDRERVRRKVKRLDTVGMLDARVDTLPRPSRELLATMACLAGRVDLDLLRAASGLTDDEIERRLTPASAAGLLVLVPGSQPGALFHHDRTQEAVLAALSPAARRAERLRVARRLAERPEFFAVAAEQYLDVTRDVHGDDERRRVIGLFRRAAAQGQATSGHPFVERLVAAALTLVDPSDVDEVIDLRSQHHAALYNLGRLEEADEAFQKIGDLCVEPARCTAATVVQVNSLTNRSRSLEAMRLGLDHLRALGLAVPPRAELDAEIDRGLDRIYQWIDQTSVADDLARPDVTDRSRLGVFSLINTMMAPTLYNDQAMMHWLATTTLLLWAEVGPARALVGPASAAGLTIIGRRGDYRTADRVMRRVLAVGRARDYQPDLLRAEFVVLACGPWRLALEDGLGTERRVLAALIENGELQDACWTHGVYLNHLMDCVPSLDDLEVAVEDALAFAVRTGNGYAEVLFSSYRQLSGALRGTGEVPAIDQATQLSMSASPFSLALQHVNRALVAAILGRPAELAQHTAAAMPLLSAIEAQYGAAIGRLLRALSLAKQVRSAPAGQRGRLLAELDVLIGWMTARAVDAPANFLHLQRYLEAERAWAANDFHEAAHAFDLAQREVAGRNRPWHRALILEQAASFYLAHDMAVVGYALLGAARRQYRDWGAAAKVRLLDWAHPISDPAAASAGFEDVDDLDLGGFDSTDPEPEDVDPDGTPLDGAGRPGAGSGGAGGGVPGGGVPGGVGLPGAGWAGTETDGSAPDPAGAERLGTSARPAVRRPNRRAVRRANLTAGGLDLLGIATASQALSSETSVHGLQSKVVAILSAMTGATAVHLLLRDPASDAWRLLTEERDGAVSLEEAGRRRLLPPSVVLYAERTSEPLVLADATRDDRFARDPYFAGQDRCALLAVPIMMRGAQRAMLLLENRMIRGAFSPERLDGILLIAGQLAVSFDNALVHASLERKVAERTEQLATANRRLQQLSVTDPLTGLANRRRLDEVLDAVWRQARHEKTPVALAMLDIDHFKLYNDHFGHTAGDRCLQRIAHCLAANIRDVDLAARYGGEEFSIAMPHADLATAGRTAHRLRAAVAALAEPHPLADARIVTVSIGATSITPTSDDDLAALIDHADAALYRAKNDGRNRVIVE